MAAPPFSDHIVADRDIYYYLFNEKMIKDFKLQWVVDYSQPTLGGGLDMKEQDTGFPEGQNTFQHWKLISTGTGFYYLYNQVSGLVMQYTGGRLNLGVKVEDNPDQHWSMETCATPGYYYIIHRASQLALDWGGGKTALLLLKTKDVNSQPGESTFQHWLFGFAFQLNTEAFNIANLLPSGAPFDLQTASGSYVSAVSNPVDAIVKIAKTPGMNLRFDSKTRAISMQNQGRPLYFTIFGQVESPAN